MLKQVSTLGTILALSAFSWAGEVKPKYGPEAVPLSVSHEYFLKNPAPTFWAMIPYYLPQRDGRSCSLATVAMVVNAARAGTKMTASEELVTQDGLFKKVNDPVWKKGLGPMGMGIDLDQMGPLVEKSFKAYGISPLKVEVIHADSTSEELKKKLHQALSEMGQGPSTLLAANFIQGVYTGDADAGHFAPLGAYDAKNKRVLVLDPDREWYEPYWVSEETLLKGMATRDSVTHRNRGFILIKLPEQE